MSYVSPFTGDVVQPTDVSYRSFALTSDITLSWPINGNATGNYAARIMEVLPNAAGRKLYMPPANQTSVGTDALIRNLGSYSFQVVDNSGNTIITIAAGQAEYIYITTNTTVAGTWGIIAFGTGTSSADAATLAGYGLLAISTTLNQSHPVSAFTNGYTFVAADRAQTKIWSSGTGSVTLPLASSLGNNWFFLIKNAGTGTLTVNCTSTDKIDTLASKQFAPNDSCFIICDGTAFYSVGYGINSTYQYSVITIPVTGGTYTLTPIQSANLIQEYVGSLSSNVTVNFPPIVNLYVISNQTTDHGYTLTVTTGLAGSNTAIIPPGQQATIVCDGLLMFNANTVQAGATSLSIIDGNASTPAINFSSETSTGIYRPGTGQFGISVLGNLITNVKTTGIEVTGTGTFSGGIAGGTFT